jgi:hypothetical protein
VKKIKNGMEREREVLLGKPPLAELKMSSSKVFLSTFVRLQMQAVFFCTVMLKSQITHEIFL